ncbi:unnamed protein product [Brassica oleracea]
MSIKELLVLAQWTKSMTSWLNKSPRLRDSTWISVSSATIFDDNSLVIDGETMRDLLNRLSRKSLEQFNQDKETKYEFVEVIKANYHMAGAGIMFFITFLAKEVFSSSGHVFQAKSHYSYFSPNKYITCDLQAPPEKKGTNPFCCCFFVI